MKKGKIVNPDGIKLTNDKVIKLPEKGESYNYLGVLEADEMMINEMMNKMKKVYYRRVRKVLDTKFNNGNVLKAIKTWVVLVVKYSAAFLVFSRIQLDEIGRRTRKLLTMHNEIQLKSNADRLYL